jgi:dTDP-4-amino-4,6-dideoxygalactose transaminase
MIEYENLKKLNAPFFAEFKQSFSEFLDSGWYILGEQVNKFEQEFATFCGAQYSIGVASGLDALKISLMALNLPKDSEVLTPANSYIATVLAITNAGLKPVLVEPCKLTGNIDASKITAAITNKTKAIMLVHLYGAACDMRPILEIAKEYNLKIVEDCAQAHGAKYHGQHVGTFAEFGAFSFYPTKNLGALGDGGAITTNDESLYKKCKMLRNYGESKKYTNNVKGINSRLDEVQAAFLRIKLKKLDELCKHKQALAKIYYKNLDDQYIVPEYDKQAASTYHIYPIRNKNRDKLKEYLLDNNIQSNIHYPTPVYKQEAFTDYFNINFPISDNWHNCELSLPISGIHTENDIHQVVDVLNKWSNK